MESWEKVWQVAAPMLPTRGLERLLLALRDDDPRLIQQATTSPPPLACVQDWPCEGACLLGYPFAFEDGDAGAEVAASFASNVTKVYPSTKTVGEVELQFARMCFDIDTALGEPAAVRYLLNWFDETPRDEMRQKMLPLVEAELNRRSLEVCQ